MKDKIKKVIWFSFGIIFLGIAYIGVIVPGIPWSTPSIIAAYCFAQSSEKFHNYMLNHKLFGPFIRNWRDNRVYPTYAKWAMFAVMDISLISMWFATHNTKAIIGMAITFTAILIWASRYPGSKEESERRMLIGKKLGWIK